MKSSRRTVVTSLGRIPSFPLSRITAKNLTSARQMPGLSVVHVELPPRYTHAPIIHKRTEEWFIVLKGRGHGVIGARRVQFLPGTVVYMPAGVPHQMSADGGALEILAVFSPPLDARRKDADICVLPDR